MDSDPTRVQSSGPLPCAAPVWSWCSPWHGDDGTWRRSPSTPSRIPPPLALSPPGQSPQFIPSSWGKRQSSRTTFSAPSNWETSGVPPSSPQRNADERPTAAPLPLAGRPARPAEPRRVRGTDTLPSPALLGRHSSSPRFYIKQTLPASSPAGPGNQAADLGHLGTVPPLYLDFRAKFSICEILCKQRRRGHQKVGALPACRGSLHRHHSPQTSCHVPPWMLLPTKPFRSSQSLPNLPALCSQLTPRGAGSAGDAAARTARLPAPSCPQGAGHRALFSSFRSGRADPVTFPLPALSQRKPGQGGFATGASPAAYQGKRLGNPRAAAGSAARPGAAGPGHGQVPAELRGKGRGWDLRAWVKDKRDQVNRQTMHCFPPALSALWDHELRSLRSLGTRFSL